MGSCRWRIDGIAKVLAGEISLAELAQQVDMTEALLP